MPAGVTVSGLEADGAGVFYCGGGASGKVRAVRKPKPFLGWSKFSEAAVSGKVGAVRKPRP